MEEAIKGIGAEYPKDPNHTETLTPEEEPQVGRPTSLTTTQEVDSITDQAAIYTAHCVGTATTKLLIAVI